jgi:hypothetical protein
VQSHGGTPLHGENWSCSSFFYNLLLILYHYLCTIHQFIIIIILLLLLLPLIWLAAGFAGHADSVAYLLIRGADAEIKNNNGIAIRYSYSYR